MLQAILLYSGEQAAKISPDVAAVWVKWKGFREPHPQTSEINTIFEMLCSRTDGYKHLDHLDGDTYNLLQNLVFKRMYAIKPMAVLGPIPGTTALCAKQKSRNLILTLEAEKATSSTYDVSNIAGHFIDQSGNDFSARGPPPVPPGSSQPI